MNDETTWGAAMAAAVADLEENAVLDMARRRLARGDDPLRIVEDCQEGLRRVGLRYEQQEYFISALIMAGEIFRQVMEIVEPFIQERHQGHERGLILLGTVAGDIHDIGKNNAALLLRCYGFSVVDLGVDIPAARFVDEAVQLRPHIVGLSGLLTSSYEAMEQTVHALRRHPDPALSAVPVLIGGAQVSEEVRRFVGADYWTNDAMKGVRLCQHLLGDGS